MSSHTFESLTSEIREIKDQILEKKSIWKKSEQDLIVLEQKISKVKSLQIRALAVLKDSELRMVVTRVRLKMLHENYRLLKEYIDEKRGNSSNLESKIVITKINHLNKIKENLKKKLIAAKIENEAAAEEVNEIDLQISIQKKKNTAILLRLQKDLEKYLEEERDLKLNLTKE